MATWQAQGGGEAVPAFPHPQGPRRQAGARGELSGAELGVGNDRHSISLRPVTGSETVGMVEPTRPWKGLRSIRHTALRTGAR